MSTSHFPRNTHEALDKLIFLIIIRELNVFNDETFKIFEITVMENVTIEEETDRIERLRFNLIVQHI